MGADIRGYDEWKLADGYPTQEPKVVGQCAYCLEDIIEGSDYWGVANGEYVACTVSCATQVEFELTENLYE